MSLPRHLALALCCAAALQGCGEGGPPSPARRKPGGTSRPARRSRPTTRPVASRPATQPSTLPATRPTTRAAQPATTPAGADPFDARFARAVELEDQGEFTQAWKLSLEMRTALAGHPRLRDLNQLMGRLRTKKRKAAQLAHAVKLLGGDTVEGAQIAASALADAGPIGGVLLRKTVRTGPERAAAKALEVLVKLDAPGSAEVFHERLKARPAKPLRLALLRGLRSLARHIPPAAVGDLYQAVKDRPLTRKAEEYGVLAAAYEGAAGGDPNAFDRMAGEAGAAASLKAKVIEALGSGDPEAIDAAGQMIAQLGLLRKGLRGSYYSGTSFQKLLFERLDSRILIEKNKSPYPDGRKDSISIRWTARVRIAVAGKYTFYAGSDDGVRLWVAGKQIVNHWQTRAIAESVGTIDLPTGLHPIKMEFFQGNGDFGAYLKWSGPGIEKKLLTDKHLLTPPWTKTPAAGKLKEP